MSADREVPLYVDLDGSVVRSDTLWESFASALRRHPLAAVAALAALASGRAALKHHLAELGSPDVESLPLHETLIAWLGEQRALGRRIVLATAADRTLAESVAARVGLFDAVLASDGRHNLKGRHKLAAIRSDAAGAPFKDCCGNGPEDVAIFAAARRAIVVGASQQVLGEARRQAQVDAVFEPKPALAQRLRAWIGALRPHQWLKNLLVLVPLLTSFRLDEPSLVGNALLAFASFSLAASSGYLLNDLLDLAADRRHRRKRERAFAAGRLSVRSGFAGSAALLVASLAIAWVVGERFAASVLVYLAMTAMYWGWPSASRCSTSRRSPGCTRCACWQGAPRPASTCRSGCWRSRYSCSSALRFSSVAASWWPRSRARKTPARGAATG